MIHVYLSGDPVHDRVLKAFYDGCPFEKRLLDVKQYLPSEVAVVFGVYKSAVAFSQYRGRIIDAQRAGKKQVVVLETGYLRRGDGPQDYYAAGLGGLNGRADFRNQQSPCDRWEALGIDLKPWGAGEAILLAAQVPWDASVEMVDYTGWLFGTVARIKAMTTRPILFRPHPKARLPRIEGLGYSEGPIRWEDIHAVVTYSSNLAVEGIIEGVPAIVDDPGAMSCAVANRHLGALENPVRPDRRQWAYDLAYTQWTPQEMAEGLAWAHLFRS